MYLVHIVYTTQHNHELVAPQSGDQVFGTQTLLEALRYLDQELVTGVMPQTVIDEFEAVEVEKENRIRLVRTNGPFQTA